MQKENRNNRVHTGEQSGKTDFLIERLLPVGKENAITTQDLIYNMGLFLTVQQLYHIWDYTK